MSVGKDLNEMEVGTTQSKTVVNANAKPGMPMDTSVAGSYEDLGGPTPENYKPDDDSSKLKTENSKQFLMLSTKAQNQRCLWLEQKKKNLKQNRKVQIRLQRPNDK